MKTMWIKRKWDVLVLIIAGALGLCTVGAVGYQGREQAKRVVCATHISQNLQALLAYAADDDGDLPQVGSGYWLQDMSIHTIMQLLDYGATMETFYCPSNEAQMQFMDYFWLFGVTNNSGDPNDWDRYWDGQGFRNCNYNYSYSVAGYFFLLSGDRGSRDNADIQSYDSDTGEKVWLDSVYTSNPSERELVTDNLMGVEDEDTRWGYNFGQIRGGLYQHGIVERSNHLISDEEPGGSNIGFLDGHVSWRRWEPPAYPMVVDGKAVPRWNVSAGAIPACWW